MIIRKIKNWCQTKHPRLRSYRNEVWDLVENYFEAFNLQFIPREENKMEDSLAVAASTFKPLINPRLRYEIELRHRPSIPDNVKNWQVFEDDEKINQFLAMIGNFEDIQIDLEVDESDQGEMSKNLK